MRQARRFGGIGEPQASLGKAWHLKTLLDSGLVASYLRRGNG
jgi:hypothetical protein